MAPRVKADKPAKKTRPPKLPKLLDRKIYKTGQTRGADDDEIFQNRVSRASTVLIPYGVWKLHFTPEEWAARFAKGYIVLVSPNDYFADPLDLATHSLTLGQNAVVFYETRTQWLAHDPAALGWIPAESRLAPLGGQYVARISATTAADNGAKIIHGFSTTANKGAGIRVYEYAPDYEIAQCRYQLEALFWLCVDSHVVAVSNGMTDEDAVARKAAILVACEGDHLLDLARLTDARILNKNHRTVCPLCLEELSSAGFFSRMEQAAGREVLDLTITEINLFHIEELRMGGFNHRPYNLGWGHHHCNVVVKDAGILQTLEWMNGVLKRNIDGGHFPTTNKGS
jgi:hypothetical protein